MTEQAVKVSYQLAQLPGASYRAGLAGLIFLINFLHRSQPDTKEKINIEYDSLGATLTSEKNGLQALIDLTFDARYEMKWSKKEIDDPAEVKETDEGKLYGWKALRIVGAPLEEREPTGGWTSLWSDCFSKAIRVKPRSHIPFNSRLKGDSVEIKTYIEALKKPNAAAKLSSSLLPGSESGTPEGTAFSGNNSEWFLLNFWPFVSQPYIPWRFNSKLEKEDWGYVIAIPDVQNLKAFVSVYPNILERRRPNPPNYPDFRPPLGSLIELPEEAALDSLQLIRRYMEETQISSSFEYDVLGFEIVHIYPYRPPGKTQKNADLISLSYIQPDTDRDSHYDNYRDKFLCPWFRRHLLQNLVKNRPWTARWGEVLSKAPQKWFEAKNDEGKDLPGKYFPHDCKLVFNSEENIVETSELIQILKSLCDRYLNARLASKGEKINNWESKHKLARQEFLAIRARPQKDAFRKYFYETLCSQVTPVLLKKSLSTEEYEALSKEEKQQQAEHQNAEKIRQMLLISEALDKDTETVRGLTMLALASNFQFAERSNSSAESVSN